MSVSELMVMRVATLMTLQQLYELKSTLKLRKNCTSEKPYNFLGYPTTIRRRPQGDLRGVRELPGFNSGLF